MMKTKQLLDNGVIHLGEPKHYSSWENPGLPKLRLQASDSVGQALYRRQKAHAPRVEFTPRRGLQAFVRSLLPER